MKLILFLSQSRDIDIIGAVETDRTIQPLRSQGLDDDCEPLWSSQPVLHKERLCARSLARDLLHYSCHLLRMLSSAHEMVQQPRAVRLREENGAVVLLLFCGHRLWVISELVVPGLVRLYTEGVRPCPVLSVYDWVEEPGGVGPVVDAEVTDLFKANSGSEM